MINAVARIFSGLLLGAAFSGMALAQGDVFSAGSNNSNGGPNTSQPTGTQGVVGNPFCAPPHEIINGKDVTPLNWSCPTVQQPYVIPQNITVAHPGPAYQSGAANPCQPGGPGAYNYLDNPVGTQLPPGCVRPTASNSVTKTDARYEPVPLNDERPEPGGPPGSYLVQPEGPPGSYIVPSEGPPGSYIQPDVPPGGYIDSTARSGPGGSGTQVNTGPNGAILLSPPAQQNEASSEPYRQDTQAMQGGLDSGYGEPARQTTPMQGGVYSSGNQRQDTGAMQGAISGNNGGMSFIPGPSAPQRQDTQAMQAALGNALNNIVTATPPKTVTPKKSVAKKPAARTTAAAAPNIDPATLVNGVMNLFGRGP